MSGIFVAGCLTVLDNEGPVDYSAGSFFFTFPAQFGIINGMIRRTVHKHRLDADYEIKQNLRYWLGRTPQERLAAVDLLRRRIYGDTQRLQRTARVVQRSQS